MQAAKTRLYTQNYNIDRNPIAILRAEKPDTIQLRLWRVGVTRPRTTTTRGLKARYKEVSAIRYISEKEGNLEDVSFYLSQRMGESEQYSYRNLGQDIEPIFESFNIALDRISDYGV